MFRFIERKFLQLVGPMIESPPAFFRRLYWRGLFKIREEEGSRSIYLTFDDGPIPESTPWVLDVLDRFGIKATFFMVGDNVRKYPGLYEEVLRRGHRVGNHTMHHLQGAHVTTRRFVDDVAEAARYIDSDLFRPPHGWMRFRQTSKVNRYYRIVMHDIVTRDYSSYLSASDVVANVKKYAAPGSIIVFHDSLKSLPRIRESLPICLEWLISQGYEFRLIPHKEEPLEKDTHRKVSVFNRKKPGCEP